MRWLGQAQRAFDLMCERANSRVAFGSTLAEKQQIQAMIFETAAEIQACRLLTLAGGAQDGCWRPGARRDRHHQGRRREDAAQHDRPRDPGLRREGRDQRHAARAHVPPARFARIYDGPDEVHRATVAACILREYQRGAGWDFGTR